MTHRPLPAWPLLAWNKNSCSGITEVMQAVVSFGGGGGGCMWVQMHAVSTPVHLFFDAHNSMYTLFTVQPHNYMHLPGSAPVALFIA